MASVCVKSGDFKAECILSIVIVIYRNPVKLVVNREAQLQLGISYTRTTFSVVTHIWRE